MGHKTTANEKVELSNKFWISSRSQLRIFFVAPSCPSHTIGHKFFWLRYFKRTYFRFGVLYKCAFLRNELPFLGNRLGFALLNIINLWCRCSYLCGPNSKTYVNIHFDRWIREAIVARYHIGHRLFWYFSLLFYTHKFW